MAGHDNSMTVGRYLATRFSTLSPPMDHVVTPWAAMRMLNKRQWQFFLVSVCMHGYCSFIADRFSAHGLRGF